MCAKRVFLFAGYVRGIYLCIDGWVGVIAARRVDCLLLFLCGRLYELIAEICPCCYCRCCSPVGEMIERNYKRMSTIRT